MMLLPEHTIRLSHEDYEALVASQREARRIIDLRRAEEEENRLLCQHSLGHAVFITKDGLECIVHGMDVQALRFSDIKRPCSAKPLRREDETTAAIFRPLEVRTYRITARTIQGLPVFEEI